MKIYSGVLETTPDLLYQIVERAINRLALVDIFHALRVEIAPVLMQKEIPVKLASGLTGFTEVLEKVTTDKPELLLIKLDHAEIGKIHILQTSETPSRSHVEIEMTQGVESNPDAAAHMQGLVQWIRYTVIGDDPLVEEEPQENPEKKILESGEPLYKRILEQINFIDKTGWDLTLIEMWNGNYDRTDIQKRINTSGIRVSKERVTNRITELRRYLGKDGPRVLPYQAERKKRLIKSHGVA